MKLKYHLLVLPVLAVVLISGCIGGGPTTGTMGPGVVITDWKPDFSTVNSGENVRLQLRAQNQGEVRAEDVEAEIAGIDVSEWGTLGTFSEKKDLGDLIAFDKETNTPGEVQTVYWDLEAPDLAKGVDFTYKPIVKLSYDYETTAQKPITLVDESELRKIQQQGKSLPSETTRYSSGPLSVEIRTGDYVKTSDDFGTTYDIFPIYIKVTNTQWESGGTVVPTGFGDEGTYPVEMEISPPSGTSFVSSGFGSNCGSNVDLDLWQGKDAEITCELEVTNPPSYQVERLIQVDLDYRFQTESSTSIKVVGTE